MSSVDEQRLQDAWERAHNAFWASVSASFPEAKTGDFGPAETFDWERASYGAIENWVDANVPEPPDDGGLPLERARLIMWMEETLPIGFELDPKVCTGGNCYAMVATAPDRRTLYVSDGGSALPFSSNENEYRGLCFGYFDADDEEAGWASLDADVMNERNVKTLVKAWAEGDPYHDQESSRINGI